MAAIGNIVEVYVQCIFETLDILSVQMCKYDGGHFQRYPDRLVFNISWIYVYWSHVPANLRNICDQCTENMVILLDEIKHEAININVSNDKFRHYEQRIRVICNFSNNIKHIIGTTHDKDILLINNNLDTYRKGILSIINTLMSEANLKFDCPEHPERLVSFIDQMMAHLLIIASQCTNQSMYTGHLEHMKTLLINFRREINSFVLDIADPIIAIMKKHLYAFSYVRGGAIIEMILKLINKHYTSIDDTKNDVADSIRMIAKDSVNAHVDTFNKNTTGLILGIIADNLCTLSDDFKCELTISILETIWLHDSNNLKRDIAKFVRKNVRYGEILRDKLPHFAKEIKKTTELLHFY